jgi:AcrR family transcriptional regulator
MVRHEPADVRRSQLLEAAYQVCAEKGYHNSRIEDVVARAGLSKGSLYHHFASKEHLFVAVLEKMIDHVREQFERALAADTSPAETIVAVFRNLIEHFRGQPLVVKNITELYLLGMREPRFGEAIAQHYDVAIEKAAEIVRRGIALGEFSADLDPSATARALFTAGDGLFLMHALLDEMDQGERAIETWLQIAMRGLKPPQTTR